MTFASKLSYLFDCVAYGKTGANLRQEVANEYCQPERVNFDRLGFYRECIKFHMAMNAGEQLPLPVHVSDSGKLSTDISAIMRTRQFQKDLISLRKIRILHNNIK